MIALIPIAAENAAAYIGELHTFWNTVRDSLAALSLYSLVLPVVFMMLHG
jgi:RsiW-degrading membrane proteinase PrsW (M82 family)